MAAPDASPGPLLLLCPSAAAPSWRSLDTRRNTVNYDHATLFTALPSIARELY